MTLVYIYWGSPPWIKDVLACAVARAKCRIVVISDYNPHIPTIDWIPICELFTPPNPNISATRPSFFAGSIWRWFLLQEVLSRGSISCPVFCPDWDDLVLSDVNAATAPFEHYDYATTFHCGIPRPAMIINKPQCVVAFCDLITSIAQCDSPRLKSIQDSSGWASTAAVHDYRVGNLCEIHNNGVFDHSLGFGAEDGYMMVNDQPPRKKLDWFDGVPYFYIKPGRGVIARTIQCWNGFKDRIPEFTKLAGL